MPITFIRSPRRLAALIAAGLIGVGVLAGTAQADPNTYCNPPSGQTGTTTYTGADNGQWGDGDNWSNGQPDFSCDAVIPANITVVYTAGPGPGSEGTFANGAALGLTIMPGATVIVEGTSTNVSGNWSNATSIDVGGDGLTIDQGSTLDLEASSNTTQTPNPGDQPGGSANVTVDSNASTPAPVINNGTINASTSDPAWNESFNVGGTVTNNGSFVEQSGKLTFQGQGNLPYVFDNTGSLSIAAGASFTMIAGDGSQFVNPAGGTFANQGSATLQQTMHWIQNGGAETGNPLELTGPEVLEDSAGAGSFEVTNCTVAGLTGTIPATQTVSVIGGCSGTTLNLGDAANTATVVNDGTLNLTAPAGGSDGILQGSELDNYGTVNSTVGGALPLANQLLDPLVNEPGGTVNLTGGELAQTSGSTTSNGGGVIIGPGATWLVQGGAFANTGTLVSQLAGATSVGQVNLTVGGKFTAGGTLAPTPVSGYAPATGTEIPIVTGSPFSGTFGSVTNGFFPDYGKETASPPYFGVVYNAAPSNPGTGSGTTPTPTPSPTPVVSPAPVVRAAASAPKVGKVSGGAGKVTLKLTCAKGAKSCGSYSATGTVTEHVKKGKKTKTKLVTVASKSGSLKPGKPATVTLTLNRAGTALLKRFHKLNVRVVVKSGGRTVSTTTVAVTAPKATKKKKK